MRNGATSAEDSTKFRSSDLEIRLECIHWPCFADVDRLDSCWWDFSEQSISEEEKASGSCCFAMMPMLPCWYSLARSYAALSWIRLVQVEECFASTLRGDIIEPARVSIGVPGALNESLRSDTHLLPAAANCCCRS
jgi:hypothetical protein